MEAEMDNLICVFDTETTGLWYRQTERIVEIGAVLIDFYGNVIDRYETIVNPCRDVGPTEIHGITASDVIHAPTFEEIAGDVAEFFQRSKVVAAHNLAFDIWFLQHEFNRIDIELPQYLPLCTKNYFGGKLPHACEMYLDETIEDWHSAIADATATAKLVTLMIEGDQDNILSQIQNLEIKWNNIPEPSGKRFTRKSVEKKRNQPSSYLSKVVQQLHHDTEAVDGNILCYLNLLDEVLEDRIIEASEEHSLLEAAVALEINPRQLCKTHRQYLADLIDKYWEDEIISSAENQDLLKVAKLLGIDDVELSEMKLDGKKRLEETKNIRSKIQSCSDVIGKSICITGSLQACINGVKLQKKDAYAFCENAGMVRMNGVTKKLDILVSSDANSQSDKMKKARQYNVTIYDEVVLWGKLGIPVD